MVQMLFFIRFRGQLRRTRPELISSLEDAVTAAASSAGADAQIRNKVLTASFDEGRIGFWLDMVIFLERVQKALEKAAGELYGCALVLGQDIPETSFQMLCRSLSGKSTPGTTGIWCSGEVRKALDFYAVFEPGGGTLSDDAGEYRKFREWRPFGSEQGKSPYGEKIERALARGNRKNAVLLGPEFIDTKDGVNRYCASLLGNIPPLLISFENNGLVSIADAWTPDIRSFIADAVSPETLKELDAVHSMLFRERLRKEWSPYMIDQCRHFLGSLLTAYVAAVKVRLPYGVLILENLSRADAGVVKVVGAAYSSLNDKEGILLLALDKVPAASLSSDTAHEEILKNWGGIFTRVLKFTSDDFPALENYDVPRNFPRSLPRDLWEAAYNIFLLGQYFPACLFPRLFEEEGLNGDMYFRALKVLTALGVFAPGSTRPGIPGFASLAEKALGNRKANIRSTVRKLILSWAESGRLRSCFNLIRILSDLGERAGDALILRSLKADVLNGTWKEIETALGSGDFSALVGAGNAHVLTYIYKTTRVLVWGEKDEIQRVFQEPVPPAAVDEKKACYGAYRAQVQANLAAFNTGSRNIEAASDAVRKAMHLNRDLGHNAVPVYRAFSLVNLSKKRIDDALEYISFALEQAEKTEQAEELVITCYFAAAINFLYGNLSRAERLALRAEKTLGQSPWRMRAGFLRGRINFETGRYADALEIFESLRTERSSGADNAPANDAAAPVLQPPAMAGTIQAWIARTEIFLGRVSSAENIAALEGPDEKIFAIEAAYFAADYQKAVALADDFLSSAREEPEGNFLFTEQPDWRSGFAQCESMLLPEKVPGTRLAWIYRAMAQCAVHPSPETKAEMLGGMQRFIRDELLPDTDPNDAFYFYAWYCMLRDSKNTADISATQLDMSTVVSMAFKRLQRRAGRIDDAGTKQAFLTLSRWNNTLSLAAREYKLI